MTTITMPGAARTVPEEKNAARAGVLRRLLAAIVAARIDQAERTLAAQLAGMSDGQLAGLGLSTAEIAAVRAGKPFGDLLSARAKSAD